MLQTVAEARDVITLSSANASPYDVTLQLLVSGVITKGANSQIAAKSLISLSSAGVLQQTDSGLYDASGVVNDTLSVTLTVAGPSVVIEIESLLSLTVLRGAAGETVSGDLRLRRFDVALDQPLGLPFRRPSDQTLETHSST